MALVQKWRKSLLRQEKWNSCPSRPDFQEMLKETLKGEKMCVFIPG